ncbi:MAG TPA: UDP-3-O-(3-hydroxymyristoyl)glucosamine N-acyltransferase [Caulobacteraceae bacterium]
MPDPRFYEDLGPVAAGELAVIAGARLGDGGRPDKPIALVAPLGRADPRAASFFADRRYLADLAQTRAGACFIRADHASGLPDGCLALIADRPQAAYARASARLHRARRLDAGAPRIHPAAMIEADVVLHHGAVVGPGVQIGRGSEIGANAVIGPGVAIGRDCVVGANVTIGFALIGDRVRIMAGAVIGEAGFGVAADRSGALDIPQLGRVVIQDGVSVGAGACIDRGAWDDTVIGENSKIDNLVQIAHNVQLGRNCILAAQVGVAGSVVVGDGAMFGGAAAIADHLTVGSGAMIAGTAGVMHNVPAGERWAGAPAKPVRQFMRESAWVAKMAAGRGKAEET